MKTLKKIGLVVVGLFGVIFNYSIYIIDGLFLAFFPRHVVSFKVWDDPKKNYNHEERKKSYLRVLIILIIFLAWRLI